MPNLQSAIYNPQSTIHNDTPPADALALTTALAAATARAIGQLRATDPTTLLEARDVGRQHVPSTVLGLLVHGGEHSARHAGQALTLRRVVLNVKC